MQGARIFAAVALRCEFAKSARNRSIQLLVFRADFTNGRRCAALAQIRKYEIRTYRSEIGLGSELGLGLDLGLVRLGATNQNYEQIVAQISQTAPDILKSTSRKTERRQYPEFNINEKYLSRRFRECAAQRHSICANRCPTRMRGTIAWRTFLPYFPILMKLGQKFQNMVCHLLPQWVRLEKS